MSIQRYHYDADIEDLHEAEDGEFVRSTAHQAALSSARDRVKVLEEALKESIEWIKRADPETWGKVVSDGGESYWYIRDELAERMTLALKVPHDHAPPDEGK